MPLLHFTKNAEVPALRSPGFSVHCNSRPRLTQGEERMEMYGIAGGIQIPPVASPQRPQEAEAPSAAQAKEKREIRSDVTRQMEAMPQDQSYSKTGVAGVEGHKKGAEGDLTVAPVSAAATEPVHAKESAAPAEKPVKPLSVMA